MLKEYTIKGKKHYISIISSSTISSKVSTVARIKVIQ